MYPTQISIQILYVLRSRWWPRTAGHDPLNSKSTRGKMKAGLIIMRVASLGRDAQNKRDEAAATQLRRSSISVAATAPSQQHCNLPLKCWSSHGTSRRDAAQQHLEEGREVLLLRAASAIRPSSFSSVAAAAASSQQQATAVSPDDERLTGAFSSESVRPSASLEALRQLSSYYRF